MFLRGRDAGVVTPAEAELERVLLGSALIVLASKKGGAEGGGGHRRKVLGSFGGYCGRVRWAGLRKAKT